MAKGLTSCNNSYQNEDTNTNKSRICIEMHREIRFSKDHDH